MSIRAILRFSDAGPYASHKELRMTSRLVTVSTTLALLLSVAACGNISRRDQNTATGAAIGGVAGAVLTLLVERDRAGHALVAAGRGQCRQVPGRVGRTVGHDAQGGLAAAARELGLVEAGETCGMRASLDVFAAAIELRR
jgi:hypothetical protein